MICRHCGYEAEIVGFKTTCEKCSEYLHSCYQCNLYNSRSERCRSMTTEAVSDLTGNNYCEEFAVNTDPPRSKDYSGGGKATRTDNDFNALFGQD